jgi:hypothetical protein
VRKVPKTSADLRVKVDEQGSRLGKVKAEGAQFVDVNSL